MRIRHALVPLVLAGTLLAGCGGDGGGGDGAAPKPKSTAPTDNGVAALSPNEILDKATAALESAKSYRVKGDIDTDGQKMSLDFKISGKDLLGSITSEGATIELLAVGGQNYIRPDEAFWKANGGDAGATMAQLMGDRWARLSTTDKNFSQLFKITDPSELLKPKGQLSKGETKQVTGGNAVGIIESGTDGGTLWVATTGEPYPLMLEGPKGEGQLTFSDFGATFSDVVAPADTEVIDLDKLRRGN
ncbi:MAG TPA: hypothetical protein VGJ53_14570 [Micromonosporaceae bacterium]|jgi:hypothetical protein